MTAHWGTFNTTNATVSEIDTGFGLTGGPITTSGTISVNLTPNNGGIVYTNSTDLALLSGTATARRVLLSGASSAPSWSTATYPSTVTSGGILYASASNVIDVTTSQTDSALITNSSGVPSLSHTLPDAVQGNITSLGAISTGTWNADTITVPYGGTGVTSTTSYGVVCGGTTSTGVFQNAGAGTSGQYLKSNGTSSLPTWATHVNETITLTGDVTGSGTASIATTLANTIARSSTQLWNFSADSSFALNISNTASTTIDFSLGQTVTSPNTSYIFRYNRSNDDITLLHKSNTTELNIMGVSPTDLSTIEYRGVGIGRAKGTGGISNALLEIYGPVNSTAGPHIQCVTNVDAYPNYQVLAYAHNNIATTYDAYFDGNWRSSNPGSNFQIYKVGDEFQVNYANGISQGSVITWTKAIYVDKAGTTWLSLPSGGCYMNNNATATSVTANTWTKLSGTTTSASLEKFIMPSNNRLTYTGNGTITCEIIACVTIQHNALLNHTVGISIYKNGTKITPSEQYATVGMGSIGFITAHTFVSLSANDFVEVYGVCDATAILTPLYFTFYVKSI